MLRLYDFECPKGHTFEALVDLGTQEEPCRDCGVISTKIISPIKCNLDPLTFPGASSKWIREHERAGKPAKRAE